MGAIEVKASVKRQIKHFGSDARLITKVKIGNDLDAGQGLYDENPTPLLAVLVKYKPFEFIEGLIGVNDWRCILQYDGVINKGDEVIVAGVHYEVITPTKVVMNDTIIKYTLQVRS